MALDYCLMLVPVRPSLETVPPKPHCNLDMMIYRVASIGTELSLWSFWHLLEFGGEIDFELCQEFDVGLVFGVDTRRLPAVQSLAEGLGSMLDYHLSFFGIAWVEHYTGHLKSANCPPLAL